MTILDIDLRVEAGETVKIPAHQFMELMKQSEMLPRQRCWATVIDKGVISLSKPKSGLDATIVREDEWGSAFSEG